MKHGFTTKSQGCAAMNRGIVKQPQNEACSARIEQKLREDGKGSMQRVENRINDQLAEHIKSDIEQGGELAAPGRK